MGANQHSNPVTDHDRQRIRELHAQGLGRNAIAREIGRAQRTVSVIAAELGLTFDTTMTEEATRHRVAQLAALRADTALDLHIDALKLTQQMWEPALVFNFGGPTNSFASEEIPEPPAADKKALMAAAGIALDKSMKLVPPEADKGEEAARGMVGQLLTGLTAVYREQQAQAADEGDGDAP